MDLEDIGKVVVVIIVVAIGTALGHLILGLF
jgi:hypothetical protein